MKNIHLAKIVISGDYPEIMKNIARYIKQEYDSRREDIQNLWDNHDLLREYRRGVMTLPPGNTQKERMLLSLRLRRIHGEQKLNQLHKGMSALKNILHKDMDMQGLKLRSCMQVLESKDHGRMLMYMERVNSRTPDDTLSDVRFLRYIEHGTLAEILLWKIFKNNA